MQKYRGKVLIILVITCFCANVYSQEKLAQTGFQFLSVAADARGGAMADAMTTMALNSSSLFYNPAGMARMECKFDATATQNNWIAGITHNSFSLALNPFQGRLGVFGMSVMAVDYGEIQGTMVMGNEQGYIDTEIFNPSAFAFGFGYAKTLTDKFSVGGQVKYTGQQLGRNMVPVGEDSVTVKKNLAFATAFDFGTMYSTGFKSLKIGMSVRNFSEEIEFEKESFLLPLTFRIGISMDVLDLVGGMQDHELLVTLDATHPRSYPEQLKFGMQYGLMNTFFGRLGYVGNSDEDNLTFGFGIQKFGAAIDYAYTPFGVFDNVQRFTVRFSL